MEIFARQNRSFSLMDGDILKSKSVFESPRQALSTHVKRFWLVRFLFDQQEVGEKHQRFVFWPADMRLFFFVDPQNQ